MRLLSITAMLLALLMPAAALAADPCRNIVAATVAELRAGAAAWDPAIEALVRSAAGSSCVKALSDTSTAAAEAPAEMQAEKPEKMTVAASQDESLAEGAIQEQGVETAGADAPMSEPEEGKAGWKFLGFEVNSVSGNPGKKPYERKRL